MNLFCTKCGNSVPPEKNFCPKCGNNMAAQKAKMQAAPPPKPSPSSFVGAPAGPMNTKIKSPRSKQSGINSSHHAEGEAASAPRQTPGFIDAFIYPFRGGGFATFIITCLILIASGFMCCIGFLLSGYLTLFLFDVVQSSSSGKNEMPGLPEFPGVWDLISITLMTLVMGLLAIAPLGASIILSTSTNGAPASIGVILLCAVWAALYWPMAFLILAETRNLLAIMPWFVLIYIMKAPGRYLILFLCVLAAFVPYILFSGVTGMVQKPQFGPRIGANLAVLPLYWYGFIVMCRMMGRYFGAVFEGRR